MKLLQMLLCPLWDTLVSPNSKCLGYTELCLTCLDFSVSVEKHRFRSPVAHISSCHLFWSSSHITAVSQKQKVCPWSNTKQSCACRALDVSPQWTQFNTCRVADSGLCWKWNCSESQSARQQHSLLTCIHAVLLLDSYILKTCRPCSYKRISIPTVFFSWIERLPNASGCTRYVPSSHVSIILQV